MTVKELRVRWLAKIGVMKKIEVVINDCSHRIFLYANYQETYEGTFANIPMEMLDVNILNVGVIIDSEIKERVGAFLLIMKNMRKKIIIIILLGIGCYNLVQHIGNGNIKSSHQIEAHETPVINTINLEAPEFDGVSPFITINNGTPFFEEADYTMKEFESYSALDWLGRCQVAFANISLDNMPTQPREGIGMIKPSGWHTIKYDNIDGMYLYNRCHLIGYQLSGENANEKNLITGTRYMNVEGMLPFENQIAVYVKETAHHVLLRVTPVYESYNLLASGVLFEAASVEDEEIRINVYIYNEQPGIIIDHETGKSKQSMK